MLLTTGCETASLATGTLHVYQEVVLRTKYELAASFRTHDLYDNTLRKSSFGRVVSVVGVLSATVSIIDV